MKRLSLFLCAATLAATSAAPAFADIVFDHPIATVPGYPHISEISGRQTVIEYDHFSLAQDTTVTSVQWSGYRQTDQSIGQFSIAVYADNGGVPGFLLYSQNAGDGNPVDLFRLYSPGIQDLTAEQYSSTTSWALNANAKYWFSAVALDSVPYTWFWGSSAFGDNGAIVFSSDGTNSNTYPISDNLSLTLYDTPAIVIPPTVTPEPSSVVFMGSGMLTMVGMVRKRLAHRRTSRS